MFCTELPSQSVRLTVNEDSARRVPITCQCQCHGGFAPRHVSNKAHESEEDSNIKLLTNLKLNLMPKVEALSSASLVTEVLSTTAEILVEKVE